MELNIQNAKLELIQWMATLEDSSLIQKMLELKKSETTDWWNEISEEERESIELGLEDSKKGNVKPHSEAVKIYT